MASDEKILEEVGESSHDTPQAITITIMDPSALETAPLDSSLVTSVQTHDTSHGTSTLLMVPGGGQTSISVKHSAKDIIQTVTETHMGPRELPVISNISNPDEETSEESTIHVTKTNEFVDEREGEGVGDEDGEEADEPVEQHCLICNIALPSDQSKESVPVFKTQTTTTHRKISVFLGTLIGQKLTSRKAHSDIMCQQCFCLLDTVDALEVEIHDTKEEIVNKYQETVAVYGGRARRRKPAAAKKTDYVFPKVEPEDEDAQILGLEMDENFEPRVEDLMEEENDHREDRSTQDEEWEPELKRPRIKKESVDTGSSGPPKRKRGRPRKDASKPKESLDAASVCKVNKSAEDKGKERAVEEQPNKVTPFTLAGVGLKSIQILHATSGKSVVQSQVGLKTEFIRKAWVNSSKERSQNFTAQKCVGQDINNRNSSKASNMINTIKIYECPICYKTFRNCSNKNKHRRLHSNAKPYVCDKCGNSFRQRHSLKDHLQKHEAGDHYTCKYCFMKFIGKQKWMTHENKHKGSFACICEVCGMGYDNKQGLEDHRSKHTGQYRHYCSQCNKGFNKIDTLSDHLNVHTGGRPYVCKECGKRFANTGTFWQHKKLHKAERNFICDICQKAFKLSSSLKAHTKTHGGERKHACDICGQAFLKKNHLCRHVRLHTGEKPFVCEVCGQTFPRRDKLKEHQNRFHKHIDV
nr:zinc finger protein 37 homolog isoform X8 [Cherax quadricarinatus]